MSFASAIFFLFLPAVFALHWAVRRKGWQNGVLVAASYVFYGWWDWRFCFLMLASSFIDYAAGMWIDGCGDRRARKRILVTAMSANLVILGFFKYFDFFTDSLAVALATVGVDARVPTLDIVLPVGISFYTFQTMSYTLDIYYGRFRPQRNLLDYLTFVSFFPQLVAGPIERATRLLPQFREQRTFSLAAASEGCRMVLWGLVKKMVLADNLGEIVANVYSAPRERAGAELALATFCFAFQIYCDFSAYSDIAVGTARLFGIRLMRNFAYPYFSQGITEFWRRWHISLSTWFRDYVYIPLGGNRVERGRHCGNLMVTALLSGLWHGAAWHFVTWGGLHGAGLAAERMVMRRAQRRSGGRGVEEVPGGERWVPALPVLLRMAGTFILVCLGWILFRAASLGEAMSIFGRITGGLVDSASYSAGLSLARAHAVILGALAVFVAIEWVQRGRENAFAIGGFPVALRWAVYTALFWAILLFGTRRIAPFIYFRF